MWGMEDFNFESASQFLEERRKEKPPKAESPRQVILRLAPKIRELEDAGYSKREIHAMLTEKYALSLAFETFRNYLNQAQAKAKSGPR